MGKSGNPAKTGKQSKTLPPIQIDSEAAAARLAEADIIPIFEIDGESYGVPDAPRAEIALRYLALVDEGKEDAAAFYLLNEMLGKEGYKALKRVKGLSDDQFNGVVARVQAIVMPKARTPKGARR